MIRSMTGFGRYETVTKRYKISVEIKSVNHRYLDLSIKLPRKFNCFEAGMRSLLKNHIQRGKVDVFINLEDYAENKLSLSYNGVLAAEYMDYFSKMEEQFQLPNDITVSFLSRCPEVLAMGEEPEDEEEMWKLLSEAVEEGAKNFVASRAEEGDRLKTDLLEKLDCMAGLVAFVEERFPKVLLEYRTRLEDKVRELLAGASLDESRIAAEVTIFADKICVDEETVRLKNHMESTRSELLKGGSVGRKLDFIAQEMNREANTILSKANDPEISARAIDLKTEIEKVREQIQNIE